jgi:hypothetical protein
VRDELGIHLLDVAKDDFAVGRQVMSDPIVLADILWIVCGDQHEGVTPNDFGNALLGDVIEDAARALFRGVVDFFPSSRQRKALTAILDKAEQVADAMGPLLDADVKRLAAKDPQEIAKRIVQSDAVTSTPESSE